MCKKKSRIGLFATLAVLIAAIVAIPLSVRSATVYADEGAQKLPMQISSALYREWGGGAQWRVAVKCDRSVGGIGEDLSGQKDKIRVNGVVLSQVEGATVAVSSSDPEEIHVIIPKEAKNAAGGALFSDKDGNRVTFLEGLGGSANYALAETYYYYFGNNGAVGMRLYRSDILDDYATVNVSSLSVPMNAGKNACINVYFSDVIGDRQMHDMQPRDVNWMISSFKEYSKRELELYHRYGIIGEDQPESVIYKIEYGCSSFGLLEQYPGNKSNVDMTPRDVVEGIPIYSVYQIQDSVPDDGQQPLVIQVHFEGNRLQFMLKGDCDDDDRYNIAPEIDEKMVMRLKAGLMFTSGNMLKVDETFVFDPELGMWRTADAEIPEIPADTTLTNQSGYTAEESAGGDGGCGSAASAGYLPVAVVLLSGGAMLLRRKRA